MKKINKYKKIREKLRKNIYAYNVISYDCETVCPKLDKPNSYDVQNYFYEQIIKVLKSDSYYNLLKDIMDNEYDELDDVYKMAIKKELEDLTKERKIPTKFKIEGNKIMNQASLDWQESRATLDYSKFENDLDSLIEYYKKYIKLKEDKYHGYDVLLDEFEDDFTSKMYDDFFNQLEEEILPLLKQILKLPKKYNTKIKELKFDIDKQRKITNKIANILGYNLDKGYIGETIHPFTSGFNINDCRITTSYNESLLFSNIYSVIHEIGHATYELNIDPKFSGTVLCSGTSSGIHESQSRFYENYLTRSKEFIEFLYPLLKEEFSEELKDITLDDIYYYINDVSNQPIRTEADELTYPFHILIRYKVEKALFSGEIKAKDVSNYFNDLMVKYFDYLPKNKKEGAFQDIHWTSSFGYFPSYALGNAYGAMFLDRMKKDIDLAKDLREGNFKNINEWLRIRIHKYGSSKKNFEIIKECCNEDFNPKYYIEYLKNKFKKIYNI